MQEVISCSWQEYCTGSLVQIALFFHVLIAVKWKRNCFLKSLLIAFELKQELLKTKKSRVCATTWSRDLKIARLSLFRLSYQDYSKLTFRKNSVFSIDFLFSPFPFVVYNAARCNRIYFLKWLHVSAITVKVNRNCCWLLRVVHSSIAIQNADTSLAHIHQQLSTRNQEVHNWTFS